MPKRKKDYGAASLPPAGSSALTPVPPVRPVVLRYRCRFPGGCGASNALGPAVKIMHALRHYDTTTLPVDTNKDPVFASRLVFVAASYSLSWGGSLIIALTPALPFPFSSKRSLPVHRECLSITRHPETCCPTNCHRAASPSQNQHSPGLYSTRASERAR